MSSLCAICGRVSRGFGFKPPKQPIDFLGCVSLSSLSSDQTLKHFCSTGCQDIFYEIFTQEVQVNKTDLEIKAEQSVLIPLGDYVASIGLQTPLSEYSKAQITGLVSTIIDHYHATLQTLTKDEIPF